MPLLSQVGEENQVTFSRQIDKWALIPAINNKELPFHPHLLPRPYCCSHSPPLSCPWWPGAARPTCPRSESAITEISRLSDAFLAEDEGPIPPPPHFPANERGAPLVWLLARGAPIGPPGDILGGTSKNGNRFVKNILSSLGTSLSQLDKKKP